MNAPNLIQSLLDEKIAWVKEVGRPRWLGFHNGEKCELRMNDFPDEPLYTLFWQGQSMDFDNTPSRWTIP